MRAISTIYFSDRNYNSWIRPGYECSILKWCYMANKLKSIIQLDVLVLTDANVTWIQEECPGASIVTFDENLKNTVHDFRKRHKHIPFYELGVSGLLMKWQVVSLLQYESVLFTDVDVDLEDSSVEISNVYKNKILKHWKNFEISKCALKANSDHESPVNTGAFLLKPSLEIYKKGLQALHHTFSLRYGYNMSGTLPYKKNWKFLDAASDQGLFSHVYIQHFSSLCSYSKKSIRSRHFWGPYKPWKWNDCAPYFKFLHNTNKSYCSSIMNEFSKKTGNVDHCRRKGKMSGIMVPIL